MNDQEFNSFFKLHSKNVDNANRQGFWKLTDDILRTYLLDNIKKRDNVVLVDFGGGTGRWLQDLDPYFKNSQFIIVDLSDDMLSKAKDRIANGAYKNSVTTVKADISRRIDKIKANSIDYIISTYNPLSFVDSPQAAISEAYRILKPNGIAQITVQGYYNALSSKVNNYIADETELKEISAEYKVKWNKEVPKLWQLPKDTMEALFRNSGFSEVESRGIATIIQPQEEDFDPENKALGSLSRKLKNDSKFYNTLLNLELVAGKTPDVVNRGMNILTIGKK